MTFPCEFVEKVGTRAKKENLTIKYNKKNKTEFHSNRSEFQPFCIKLLYHILLQSRGACFKENKTLWSVHFGVVVVELIVIAEE